MTVKGTRSGVLRTQHIVGYLRRICNRSIMPGVIMSLSHRYVLFLLVLVWPVALCSQDRSPRQQMEPSHEDRTLSPDGLVWMRSINAPTLNQSASAVCPAPHGGVALVGSTDTHISVPKTDTSEFLMELDADGRLQWICYPIGNRHTALSSIVPARDGGYLLTTSTPDWKGFDAPRAISVIHVNARGAVVWERTVGSKALCLPEHSVGMSDGGLAIVSVGASTLHVTRTDAEANLLWERVFRLISGVCDAIETPDGGVAILGGPVCVLLSANGDSLFTTQLHSPGLFHSYLYPLAMQVSPDAGVGILSMRITDTTIDEQAGKYERRFELEALRLDAGGAIVGRRILNGLPVPPLGSHASDGSMFIGGMNGTRDTGIWLRAMRFDVTGQLLGIAGIRWNAQLPPEPSIFELCRTTDGGVVLVGNNTVRGEGENVFVAKLMPPSLDVPESIQELLQ